FDVLPPTDELRLDELPPFPESAPPFAVFGDEPPTETEDFLPPVLFPPSVDSTDVSPPESLDAPPLFAPEVELFPPVPVRLLDCEAPPVALAELELSFGLLELDRSDEPPLLFGAPPIAASPPGLLVSVLPQASTVKMEPMSAMDRNLADT
ncbi:MAG: hypothetical protein ACM3ZE_08760, partial [Myxococcales bacterium]